MGRLFVERLFVRTFVGRGTLPAGEEFEELEDGKVDHNRCFGRQIDEAGIGPLCVLHMSVHAALPLLKRA